MSDTKATTAKANELPVFYTRDTEKYQGTKVSLVAVAQEAGKNNPQYKGLLGTTEVQLWEANGPRGTFFNVKKSAGKGQMQQIGTANAFVNARGFNALSVSLRFDTEDAANAARTEMGIKDTIKPRAGKDGKNSYYINIYSDVSRRAVEANKEYFGKIGFRTEFDPIQK